ncbi:MAG TPA: chemotaxis protein CheW [Stellaceae bacterium]|nr:chemotaxis protein CheW [Stellaceae bacterium]
MSAQDFVIVTLAEQSFGIPVMQVRDVLRRQRMTPVPLAPHAVAGLLNLRGRIVTAFDLRVRLGLAPRAADADAANVVVELGGELYALIVDAVGDVLTIPPGRLERVPATLDPVWREIAAAAHAADHGLVVLLDIARVLDLTPQFRNAS